MREPLFQDWSAKGGMEEMRPAFADQVSVRSLGWDINLSFDGVVSYRLPHGWMASFDMPSDAVLWAVALDDD